MNSDAIAAPETGSRQQRILIVDDNRPNLQVMANYLESCDYGVLVAQDGEDALVIARNTHPDLILLDVMLPNIDGFETCRRLKAAAETRDIPVIFMTILEAMDHKLEGFRVGAVDYVTKPFQKEEVLARITTQLRLRELTEHLEQEVQARTHELNETMTQMRQLNAQLKQEIDERKQMSVKITHLNAVLRAIRNVNQLIVRENDQEQMLQTACETLIETRGYNAAWIILIDTAGNPAQILRAGNNAAQQPLEEHVARGEWPPWIRQQVLDAAQGLNAEQPGIYGQTCRHEENGKLVVRLQHGETFYGVLTVSLVCDLLDDEEEHDLLREVASDIAYALNNLEKEQRRQQAEDERERLLVQLREQARRVQQIIDTVPEGVLLLDDHGHIVLANPVARDDLRLLTEGQRGDPVTHLGEHPLSELLAAPATKGLWHEVRAKNHVYEIIARPMPHAATPGAWVMILNDITRQREVERSIQRQERMAVVGQLAAGIAHDFNNIMAVIVLYSQMLARADNLSPHEQERLTIIKQQAQHATKLIQQILDFSRQAVLERQTLDLLPLFKEQIKLLRRTLPENIHVSFEYEPGTYVTQADPTRMQQMLMNLVVNARDAMPDGGALHISLTMKHLSTSHEQTQSPSGPGEWICIDVKDSGTGIPPDVLPHIYEPFFTTKTPGSGSGLGLAQVHGIVGAHDGFIEVKTGPGEGTTFTVCLPVLTPPSPQISSEEPKTTPLDLGHNECILVVEDNPSTREALIESLEFLNYRTLAAENGQEALALLAQQDEAVDLIMSDMVMPVMGGRSLVRSLQAQNVAIPVILLTGHPLTDDMEDLKGSASGTFVVEWLLKPYSLEQLANIITQALKHAS